MVKVWISVLIYQTFKAFKKINFLYISSDVTDGLTPFQLKKIQKMNRELLVKNLDDFPQNS